jgi:hypothetical protein
MVTTKRTMTQNSGNGKATMARLEQQLADYIKHTDEKIDLFRESYDSINDKIDRITTILTGGDGKIRETRQMVIDHCKEHQRKEASMYKQYGLIISICAIIATIISIAIKIA